VLPGDYQVQAFLVSDQKRRPLGEKVRFKVAFADAGLAGRTDLPALKAYWQEALDLNLDITAMSEILKTMGRDLEALRLSRPRARTPDPDLDAEMNRLRDLVLDLNGLLFGDPVKAVWAEPRHGGLMERVWQAVGRGGSEWSPLTKAQLDFKSRVGVEATDLKRRIGELRDKDFPALLRRAQAAGYPWVPGFGLY
jgi:hypothetical protein